MRRLALFFIACLLLVSCGEATAQSVMTPIETPTNTLLSSTPTLTLTFALEPTSTSTYTPTVTMTPGLPDNIKFKFDKAIPEKTQDDLRVAVDQAYWFYVDLGCSPEFHFVNLYAHDVYLEGSALDGITWGWNDFSNEPWRHVRITISHEMVHIMCQIAITRRANTGLELRWLFEGIANYFSEMEQIRFVPSGWGANIAESENGMVEAVALQNLCDFPLNKAELDTDSGELSIRLPDYAAVGQAATIYLATTTPDGLKALINYYIFLKDMPKQEAFQKAFGITKEDFYKQFQEECHKGFPILNK